MRHGLLLREGLGAAGAVGQRRREPPCAGTTRGPRAKGARGRRARRSGRRGGVSWQLDRADAARARVPRGCELLARHADARCIRGADRRRTARRELPQPRALGVSPRMVWRAAHLQRRRAWSSAPFTVPAPRPRRGQLTAALPQRQAPASAGGPAGRWLTAPWRVRAPAAGRGHLRARPDGSGQGHLLLERSVDDDRRAGDVRRGG